MKVAVVGAGGVGARRAKIAAETEGVEVAIVADVRLDRAKEVAKSCGAVAIADWREIVSSPEIGAVIVSASNDLHAPVSIAALEAGKDVLCEKPLARTPDEAEGIYHAVKRTGRKLKTGFNHRHYPNVLRAHEIASSGELGSVLWMRCRYGHRGTYAIDKGWFVQPELSGGGTFLDNGVHALDLCRWFMGDFVEACGFTDIAFWREIAPVEDNGFGLFRTAEGRVAQVHASWNQWESIFSVEIYLERGSLVIDGADCLRIARRGEVWGEIGVEEIATPVSPDDSWRLDWLEFLTAVREDRAPMAGAYDGWKAVQMAWAVYASSKERRFVAL